MSRISRRRCRRCRPSWPRRCATTCSGDEATDHQHRRRPEVPLRSNGLEGRAAVILRGSRQPSLAPQDDEHATAMKENLHRFFRAARGAGVRVSPAESIDAMRAVAAIGFEDRGILRDTLLLTLAKTQD